MLEGILGQIITAGSYEAALLSDSDGLLLATVATDDAAGMMAAMTALLRQSASQAREQLQMAQVDELSLVADDRFRLVCRFFQTDTGQILGLTLVVPPDHSYRRITNSAISRIKRVWCE
jgi:predicted regulator of Ras-like GTPase activity (Roadblock/LC7/MglB family)